MYEDCLGTVRNLHVQHDVLFKHEPCSDIALYAETLGNSLSDPTNRRWFCYVNNKKPEVAFAVLNNIERVYLKMAELTKNRGMVELALAGRWDEISPAPYEELAELAEAITTKLHSAARGGEVFTACTLYENSEKARAIARLK